jgi:RNase P/RNase MRP subunit p29
LKDVKVVFKNRSKCRFLVVEFSNKFAVKNQFVVQVPQNGVCFKVTIPAGNLRIKLDRDVKVVVRLDGDLLVKDVKRRREIADGEMLLGSSSIAN